MPASAGASPSRRSAFNSSRARSRATVTWRREHEPGRVAGGRGEVLGLVDLRPKRAALELAMQRLMVAPAELDERRTVAARRRQRAP
jgi:hypothetical protein